MCMCLTAGCSLLSAPLLFQNAITHIVAGAASHLNLKVWICMYLQLTSQWLVNRTMISPFLPGHSVSLPVSCCWLSHRAPQEVFTASTSKLIGACSSACLSSYCVSTLNKSVIRFLPCQSLLWNHDLFIFTLVLMADPWFVSLFSLSLWVKTKKKKSNKQEGK